jgi:hypothetical protein
MHGADGTVLQGYIMAKGSDSAARSARIAMTTGTSGNNNRMAELYKLKAKATNRRTGCYSNISQQSTAAHTHSICMHRVGGYICLVGQGPAMK